MLKGNARLAFSAWIAGMTFISLFAMAAPAAAGQGAANPAGIMGQVTDGSGAVLPGVTVTATSPALQVPSVTTVSDEQGDYRLSPLPIGTYAVFNAMNVNTIKQRVARSGPDFLRPFTGEAAAATVIILPRIVQFGVSFSF